MTKQTRRRFLEDSLLAAAAAALAATPATRAWAADDAGASPNEKLGAAIVGVRGRGGEHLKALASRKDVQILYIVDADEKVGQQRAEQVEKAAGYRPAYVRDMRKAFEDKALDIVTTATPNHWHSLVSIWAIQAGKDVYVEKPISHNVSEGRRVVEAARKYNRICQAGTQCRSMQGSIDAIEFVKAGKIGQVKVARGLCYKRRPSIGPKGTYEVPKEVDYDLWLGPAPLAPLTRPQFHYDWHWQWPYGNGDLGNQGIHQMDVARWGLGVNQLSDRVISYGGRLGYEDAGETANTQVVIHEFGDDKTLVFEVRGLPTEKYLDAGVGVIFHGSEGYVALTSYEGGAAFDKDGNLIQKFSGNGDHFDNFITAVRSRKIEDLHGEILEGHLSSALCHMGNISYLLGQQMPGADVKKQLAGVKSNDDTQATFDRVAVHLKANGLDPDQTMLGYGEALSFDPQSETFKDNDAANAMLTRQYREPYVVPAAGQV
jgi:predicted dehydrogenase